MPLYEYLCTGCGRRIDVIHGIHASGPDQCDVCGAPLRKAVSAPAIVFKGSGWAKKDARDKVAQSARRAGADDGKAAASDSAGTGSKASDGATSDSGPGQAASTAATGVDAGGTSKATGSDSSERRSAARQGADRQGAARQGSERQGSTAPSSSPATSPRDSSDG